MKAGLVLMIFMFSGLSYAEGVVIVNKNCSIAGLGRVEVQQIFLKKETKLTDGQSINPVACNKCKEIADEFRKDVLDKDEMSLRAYWTRKLFTEGVGPPMGFKSDDDVLRYVESEPTAIGIVDKKNVRETVKIVFEF